MSTATSSRKPFWLTGRTGGAFLLPVLCALFLAGLPSARGESWTAPTRLSQNNAFSGFPCVTGEGSHVYAFWHDLRDLDYEIYYRISNDGGTTWGEETRLTHSPGMSRFPQAVAGPDGFVAVVWEDSRHGQLERNSEIYFTRSLDGGRTWAPEQRLTNHTAHSERPVMALTDRGLVLVWQDNYKGTFDLYARFSSDKGAVWAREQQLTEKPGYPNDPDTDLPQQPPSIFPRLAVRGSKVAVVFQDVRDDREPLRRPFNDNWEIYLRQSDDGGETWTDEYRLTDASDRSVNPDAAFDDRGDLHMTWTDYRAGNPSVYYQNVYKATPPVRVTAGGGYALHPNITVTGDVIRILWHDSRDTANASWQIYEDVSTDRGATWQGNEKLTDTPAFAGYVSLFPLGSSSLCAFEDDRERDAGKQRSTNFEIYLMQTR